MHDAYPVHNYIMFYNVTHMKYVTYFVGEVLSFIVGMFDSVSPNSPTFPLLHHANMAYNKTLCL